MNKTVQEAIKLVSHLKEILADQSDIDMVVCPPFTSLCEVNKILQGSSLALGAQDVFWEDSGAFTGEISAQMLKDVGCQYVIIGHSERRAVMRENDDIVNKKLKSSILHNIIPILCVGETLNERDKGLALNVVRTQVEKALSGLNGDMVGKLIIAYEPVWAIGTGRIATPQQAQEIHSFLRHLLSDMYGYGVASKIRLQYGGSVQQDNIVDLMKQEDVDGALVGGASLDLESFVQIIRNTARVKLCIP